MFFHFPAALRERLLGQCTAFSHNLLTQLLVRARIGQTHYSVRNQCSAHPMHILLLGGCTLWQGRRWLLGATLTRFNSIIYTLEPPFDKQNYVLLPFVFAL